MCKSQTERTEWAWERSYPETGYKVKGTTRVANMTAPAALILRSPDAVQTLNKYHRTKIALGLLKGQDVITSIHSCEPVKE